MSAAFLSFLGVMVGAALQYFASRHLDSLRTHREARTKAYTDYLLCVSENAHPDQMTSSDNHELAARIADAKCRICLYGSRDAIVAFAKFERLGAVITSHEQQEAFTAMVSVMREDSTRSPKVATDDLRAILLGVSPSRNQR